MNCWRRLLLSVGLLACAVSLPLQALTLESPKERVNLLELYTSHGCSSCPPADAWMRKLETHPGLWREFIPLAFHVDYWDSLGWPDRFASSAYSQRQRDYRRKGAIRSVYTPGFVLNGREWRQWFSRPQLELEVNERVGRLTLEIESGSGAKLRFMPEPHLAKRGFVAHLAILGVGLTSLINGGENSGRILDESFVVLSHLKTEARQDEWQFDWPDFSAAGAERLAVVAWLSRPGSTQQVQAVGGWLP